MSDGSLADKLSREHALQGYALSEWLIFALYVTIAVLAILGGSRIT